MENPLISVIMPTYNRSDLLRGALDSLMGQETGGEFRYEILVVDNASNDGTKSVVAEAAARSPMPVRYLYHDIRGDAPPRNFALTQAQGSWLAFFDDDQLAVPDWLLQLYHTAMETGAPIVGGSVHLDIPPDVLAHFGPYVRRTAFRETDYPPTVHRFRGKRLPGCANVLVAQHVFAAIGTFDASMAWGGSDSDFFLRARAAGIDMYYNPQAIIRHRIPANRLTAEYLRWDAQQGCLCLAAIQYRHQGRSMVVLLCLARIGQAILVLLPGVAWAQIRNNEKELFDYQMRFWRTVGYIRRAMSLLFPRWFSQERYFARLKFCKGRSIGQSAVPMGTAP